MPLFDIRLEREATVLQEAWVTIEAPTEKEARLKAIEDDYGEAQWEEASLLDWTQPTVVGVFDGD